MSTLSVSQIQNTASPTTNVVLNADGSVTVGLYRAGIAPTPVQTGTLWYDIGGAGLVIWNGTAWAGVGGGSGTVTGVTGTLPIVSTGGAAPVLSINAATAALPGSVQLANAAASQAGTSAALVSTPAFSVPKDAAGMTGAALIPGGVDGGRPGTPAGGMFRYNTTLTPDSMEFYDATAAAWIALATFPQLQGVSLDAYSNFSAADGGGVFTDTPVLPATVVRNSIVVPAGYTNFIVYSSVAFSSSYDTTAKQTAMFNMISVNDSTPSPVTALAYQAVANTGASNVDGLQIAASAFTSATSSPLVSNTFYQAVGKNNPFGPILPRDSSIVVLAWTI